MSTDLASDRSSSPTLTQAYVQLRKLRAVWVRWTNPGLETFLAKKADLVDQLQASYGIGGDDAARIVDEWIVTSSSVHPHARSS